MLTIPSKKQLTSSFVNKSSEQKWITYMTEIVCLFSKTMSSIGRMQKFCKRIVTQEPATSKKHCRSEKDLPTP